MIELFKAGFYYVDLMIGFSLPVFFYFLYRSGKTDKLIWHLFWIGAFIGLAWEVPIFILSGQTTSIPIISWIRPLPFHYAVFMIAHTLWDGGIFLIGVWLVRVLCPPPLFKQYNTRELLVLVIYGQASSLMVEISSVINEGWVYETGYCWNPVLFEVAGRPITLLPQLIWLAAPVVYYLILVTRFSGKKVFRNI
jgi:hypothetical protein